jgi:hypothetical protein
VALLPCRRPMNAISRQATRDGHRGASTDQTLNTWKSRNPMLPS